MRMLWLSITRKKNCEPSQGHRHKVSFGKILNARCRLLSCHQGRKIVLLKRRESSISRLTYLPQLFFLILRLFSRCRKIEWRSRKAPLLTAFYFTIVATTPAPTVRPPSRIANRKPSSIAIGAINSTTSGTLSPGITISRPSGNSTEPVTSVVRK